MSAGNENIFARWSRRKQAVRSSEAPAADEGQNAIEAATAEPDAEPVDHQLAAAEEADAGEPLPSLDDLTAESDLSAFLRKGVPKALKSAALRKMWSLDPAIRDYVGPSEYAWDFNKPGSMAGFGPLDANESVAEFLSTMSGGMRAGLAIPITPPETPLPPAPQQVTDVSPQQDASALPDSPADAASPAEPLDPPDVAASLQPHPPSGAAPPTAERAGATKPGELSRMPAVPQHGRAMPR